MISKPRVIKTCLPVFMTEVQNQNDEVISFQTKKEKSATKIIKDIGVNPNTICRWVQERRINQLWRSHEWSRQE
jgi:hypothetical protein